MPPFHQEMLADRVRMEAYRQALFQTVRPGQTVLDLGAGTGVLSIFACQAGAGRVYALEADDVVTMAQQLTALNVPDGRLRLINERSTRVQLPERVDVLVSDILGSFALEEGLLTFLSDARERFLKPGGSLIPSRVRLFLAPVSLPEFYRDQVEWWETTPYGLRLDPQRELAVNACHVTTVPPTALLSPPAVVSDLDLYRVEGTQWQAEASFRTDRTGVLHGLAGWFVATMAEGLLLSTAPDAPATHWKQAVFPLGSPVKVEAGCLVEAQLWATFSGGRDIWSWSVSVHTPEPRPHPIASFTHSSCLGYPWIDVAQSRPRRRS